MGPAWLSAKGTRAVGIEDKEISSPLLLLNNNKLISLIHSTEPSLRYSVQKVQQEFIDIGQFSSIDNTSKFAVQDDIHEGPVK